MGDSTLAEHRGGGRIALLSNGAITEGDVNASGGQNFSLIHSTYRQDNLVGYWTLDDIASSNVAVNAQGNSVLNGNISGNRRDELEKRRSLLFRR